MSIERYVEQIPATANGAIQLPIERSTGNFLLFQSSLNNVTITLMGDGTREVFANVNGGIYVRRVKPWTNLRIDGPIGTLVTYFVGSTVVIEDETDIRQQVAVLAGVSAVADQPAGALTDTPPVVVNAGATTNVIGNNFARRRFSLSIDTAGNVVFARKAGGANDLLLMEPGMVYQFNAFYGVDVHNPGAANTTVYIAEET
jgi:hypothetical protein